MEQSPETAPTCSKLQCDIDGRMYWTFLFVTKRLFVRICGGLWCCRWRSWQSKKGHGWSVCSNPRIIPSPWIRRPHHIRAGVGPGETPSRSPGRQASINQSPNCHCGGWQATYPSFSCTIASHHPSPPGISFFPNAMKWMSVYLSPGPTCTFTVVVYDTVKPPPVVQ